MAILRPDVVGAGRENHETAAAGTQVAAARMREENEIPLNTLDVWTSAAGIFLVVLAVLGGIWFGLFTPTEGAGAGAFIGLVMALLKGMRFRGVIDSILSVGRTSAPILLLLVTASLYSRTLAMTGVTSAIQNVFTETGMAPFMILAVMVLIWFVLGMVIDSISIMLLTVPIFAPIAEQLGYDPIAFAIVGILAIEAGLLTPPFGLLVYTVKAAIQEEDDISILRIFKSSTPYWIIMLIGMTMIAEFPAIATFLPNLLF
jgi:TRAP-type C4-dicarboxylate transport system permease large subunit